MVPLSQNPSGSSGCSLATKVSISSVLSVTTVRKAEAISVMLVDRLVLRQRRKVTVKVGLAWQTGGRVGRDLPRSPQTITESNITNSLLKCTSHQLLYNMRDD